MPYRFTLHRFTTNRLAPRRPLRSGARSRWHAPLAAALLPVGLLLSGSAAEQAEAFITTWESATANESIMVLIPTRLNDSRHE